MLEFIIMKVIFIMNVYLIMSVVMIEFRIFSVLLWLEVFVFLVFRLVNKLVRIL